MIEEIHFILHVINGIDMIFHNVVWYKYTNTNTNINKNFRILVQIRIIIFFLKLVQITIISVTIFENIIIKKHFSKSFQRYIICHLY